MIRRFLASTTAVAVLATGCSSAQIARDEQAALAAFQKADALIATGVPSAVLEQGAQELEASDPSSPVVQRAAALMRKASTPQAQADAHAALQGGAVLLKAGTGQ